MDLEKFQNIFGSLYFDLEKLWNNLVRSTSIFKSFGTIWFIPLQYWKFLEQFGPLHFDPEILFMLVCLFYLRSTDILEYSSSFSLRYRKFGNKLFRLSSILKIFGIIVFVFSSIQKALVRTFSILFDLEDFGIRGFVFFFDPQKVWNKLFWSSLILKIFE